MNTAFTYILNGITRYDKSRKLENGIILAIILIVLKIFTGESRNLIPSLLSEGIMVLAFYFIVLYTVDFIEKKKYSPLPIIINIGILFAFIFFVLSVMEPVVESVFEGLTSGNFIYTIASTFYSFMFVAAAAYIFSVFRYLFFLRQKKNTRFYFNTMLVFFLLTSLASNIVYFSPGTDYIQPALMTVTIVLITINSIRISWIAFLVKKEKRYLLIVSIVLSILSGVNIGLCSSGNPAGRQLIEYSPALHQFLLLMMIYGLIFFGFVFFTTLFHLPTAEAFDRKAREVTSLMNLSKLITQVFDFKELAETVTDITMQVCSSDSAWLVSCEDGDLKISSVRKIGYVEADLMTKALDEQCSLKEITGIRAVQLEKIIQQIPKTQQGEIYHSLAVAPLKVHNKLNGYLIAARYNGEPFDDDDQNAIGAFADYAAIAIENSKLLEESIEKERLEKELDVAREMQYKILPDKTPLIRGLDINAVFIPAFEVGGDYYDFFQIDKDKLGFVIADVSGKGISAAFVMAEVKGIFESLSKMFLRPKDILIKANEILKLSLDKKNFVTAVYGIINVTTGDIVLARAGHTPILHFREGCIDEIKPSGLGLGLDFSNKFADNIEEAEIKLKENDILLLYTDGITEAKNSVLDDFGMERFTSTILKLNGKRSIDQLSNMIMREVTVFSQGNPQHDDITLVILKWNSINNNPGEINGRI